MSLGLVTAYSEKFAPMERISGPNKRSYAERHGYVYHPMETIPSDYKYGRHPSWFKIPAIMDAMEHFDWIWWSDADVIVANGAVGFEGIIDNDHDIIGGHFIIYSKGFATMHTGSFLIRCNEWTHRFLGWLSSSRETQKFADSVMREEDAFRYAYEHRPDVRSHVKLLHLRRFSTWVPMPHPGDGPALWNPDWVMYKPGDFALHFPSPSKFEIRLGMLTQYAKLMEEEC